MWNAAHQLFNNSSWMGWGIPAELGCGQGAVKAIMGHNEGQKLLRSSLGNIAILPNSCKSEYLHSYGNTDQIMLRSAKLTLFAGLNQRLVIRKYFHARTIMRNDLNETRYLNVILASSC